MNQMAFLSIKPPLKARKTENIIIVNEANIAKAIDA